MARLYEQARRAGIDPNYWYAVERSSSLPPSAVMEVIFWGRSIALFRCSDGSLGAIANSCAHRRIKLSLGKVCADRLVCPYHGWQYDSTGRLVGIPHDLFGRSMPVAKVARYPVQERYGLVWIFPGDHSRADNTPLPEFPEAEGPHAWASVNIDFLWHAHYSIIVENLLDFTHAYLHRRSRAFEDAVLTRSDTSHDKVTAEYDAKIGNGPISGLFVNRKHVDTRHIATHFEYPYQRASIDDKIKHWCFLTPIDVRQTRVFFSIVVDFGALRVPFTSLTLPYRCAKVFLNIAKRLMIAPLIQEDGDAVEAEQAAVDSVAGERMVELNPVTDLVQTVIVRKWRAYEAGEKSAGQGVTLGWQIPLQQEASE